MVDCVFQNSSEVLEAFRRNKNNTEIKDLYITFLDDMTDEILEEILEIVASSASGNISHLVLRDLPLVTKIPAAIRRLSNLKNLFVGYMNSIDTIPSGSIVSNPNSSLSFDFLGNLNVIEPGAFLGMIRMYLTMFILLRFF